MDRKGWDSSPLCCTHSYRNSDCGLPRGRRGNKGKNMWELEPELQIYFRWSWAQHTLVESRGGRAESLQLLVLECLFVSCYHVFFCPEKQVQRCRWGGSGPQSLFLGFCPSSGLSFQEGFWAARCGRTSKLVPLALSQSASTWITHSGFLFQQLLPLVTTYGG